MSSARSILSDIIPDVIYSGKRSALNEALDFDCN